MDKIREALRRAREDDAFRLQHPVSDLNEKGPQDLSVRESEPTTATSGQEDGQALEVQRQDAPEAEPQSVPESRDKKTRASDITDPVQADSVDRTHYYPEDPHTVPGNAEPTAHAGSAQPGGLDVPGDQGPETRTGLGRVYHLLGVIAFLIALLAAVHFLIEPLDPYLVQGVEIAEWLVVRSGVWFEALSEFAGDIWERISVFLRDLSA